MKPWFIDISIYNQNIPWKLWKEHGLSGVIIKHGQCAWRDAWFEKHLGDARDAGIDQAGIWDTGAYHWPDPGASMQPQIDCVLKAVEKYKLDFWDADVEQWWASQGEYFAAINKQIPWSAVRKLDKRVINTQYAKFCAGIAPSTELLLYSANWFIQGYCPSLSTTAAQYGGHVAEYFDYGLKTYRVTWDQFYQILNKLTHPKQMLPGQKTWRLWQFSSRIILPGCNYPVDLNLINGEFGTPAPEIPPSNTEQKTVTAVGLQIKSGPGAWFKTVGWLKKDDVVTIETDSRKNTYLKIAGKEQWVNSYYLR